MAALLAGFIRASFDHTDPGRKGPRVSRICLKSSCRLLFSPRCLLCETGSTFRCSLRSLWRLLLQMVSGGLSLPHSMPIPVVLAVWPAGMCVLGKSPMAGALVEYRVPRVGSVTNLTVQFHVSTYNGRILSSRWRKMGLAINGSRIEHSEESIEGTTCGV